MISPYRKAVVAALVPVLGTIVAALTHDVVTAEETAVLVLGVLGALGVYIAPNAPQAARG